jgi:hypothetical protein
VAVVGVQDVADVAAVVFVVMRQDAVCHGHVQRCKVG